MAFSPGISGTSSSLSASTDVALNTPTSNQVLGYDGTVQKWKNVSQGGSYSGTSITSFAIDTGSKIFITQAGLNFSVGQFLRVASTATPTSYMGGPVTAYSDTNLTINVDEINGSETAASWLITASGPRGFNGDLTSVTSGINWSSTYSGTSLAFPGTHRRVLTGNTILSSVPTPAATVAGTLTIELIQQSAGTGNYTITWPTNIKWGKGKSPAAAPTGGGSYSIYHFFWDGVRWSAVLQDEYAGAS